MKPVLFSAIVILAAGVVPLPALQTGPVIQFDAVTKTVGKVVDGETIGQTFKFANRGDAQLEITAVEPTCGCTSALPVPNKLGPGQSGQIEIKIATAGLAAGSRTPAEGVSMSKTVIVRSNDPKQPAVTLTINGSVIPEIAFSEPSVYFGSNPRGKEVRKELLLEIAPDRPVKVLGIVSTDENVTATLEPVPGTGGKKVKVIAVQQSATPEGIHFGELIIKTTSQLNPELKVTVRGIVVKGLE